MIKICDIQIEILNKNLEYNKIRQILFTLKSYREDERKLYITFLVGNIWEIIL